MSPTPLAFDFSAPPTTTASGGWAIAPVAFLGLATFLQPVLEATSFPGRSDIEIGSPHTGRRVDDPSWAPEPRDAASIIRLFQDRRTLSPAPITFADVRDKLSAYAQLGDDWNGIGAPAPSATAVADAKQFLDYLPLDLPPPKLSLASDTGDIILYWRRKEIYVALYFRGTQAFDIYAEAPERPPLLDDDKPLSEIVNLHDVQQLIEQTRT